MINFPNILPQDLASVKKLNDSERERLKAEINATDPTTIFGSAKESRDPDKRYIVCPDCGNGTGSDSTPVEVKYKNGVWLYHCFKCQNFSGDLLKIIATYNNLNSACDFWEVLAIGAKLINYPLPDPNLVYSSADEREERKLIKADIEKARSNLASLPEDQRRALTERTLSYFNIGYLEDWTPPKSRQKNKKVKGTRRIIIPTVSGNHYNAVALPADRRTIEHQYWKMHAGSMELFNPCALNKELILIVEGEFDAASIWQAFEENIAVVATLGMSNWKKTLLPAIENLRGKKFIILFDAEEQARKQSAELRTKLINRGFQAASFFYYDALMERLKAQKKIPFAFTAKIDANEILTLSKGEGYFLRTLTQEIIEAAQVEFEKPQDETVDALHPSAQIDFQQSPLSGDFDNFAQIRKKCKWSHDKNGNPTKIKSDVFNYKLIFEQDPNLHKLFGRDNFRQETVFLKRAPWHDKDLQLKDTWDDTDDAELRLYLAEHYAEMGNMQRTNDFVIRVARENSFHAIRNFFENLPKWDEQERAENIFIKFLGAEDNRYTREITKHFLFGAIGRALYPGCDFQSVIVLQGAQGIGKSRLLRMLGGKHGVNPKGDSWHIALRDQLDDSHAVDAMRKGWIVEIEEFAAASRADVNSMKGVLSADDVTRRFAYERHAKTIKAHWVFAATCNDDAPLRDQTGNRRFLPVKCHNKESTIVDGMTPEYIRQVWAEAYHKFKKLFPTAEEFDADKLRLTPDLQVQAAKAAEGITQDDGLATEIKGFLDLKIPPPPIWNLLSKEERRKFFVDGGKIELELDDIKARFKNTSRKRFDELKQSFDTACEEREGFVRKFTGKDSRWHIVFYGSELRKHICAAEIFNECFGNDNRKRMPRINETLARLDGWHSGDRLQKIDPVYSDQKKPYHRDL